MAIFLHLCKILTAQDIIDVIPPYDRGEYNVAIQKTIILYCF